MRNKKKPSEKILDYHDERLREFSVREDKMILMPSYPRLLSIEFLFEAILRYLDEKEELEENKTPLP